jgi:hypothetical protein
MFAIGLSSVYDLARDGMVYSDTPVFNRSGKFRMLTSDVKFELSNGKYLVIKRGFKWDENSIPYVFQWAFPKSGIYAVPALIHDALYYLTSGDRDFADMEFCIWMCALRIRVRQVMFRFIAVHLFGGRWWNRNMYNPSKLCLQNREFIELYG